jgi:hypothetical protein
VIDFSDGAGERTIKLDEPIAVDYPSPGTKQMRLTAYAGGKALHAAFALEIAPASTMPPIKVLYIHPRRLAG